jgi:hypothetical protein
MPENDPTVARFTSQELSYILSSKPGGNADRAWGALNLPPDVDRVVMAAAGLASLFARDLVELRDEQIIFTEVAALVGLVMTSDSEWIELAFAAPDQLDAGVLVRWESTALLFSPRMFGVFEVRALESAELSEGLAALALGFLGTNSEGLVSARRVWPDSNSSIAVRLLEDGTIQMSEDDSDDIVSVQPGEDRQPVERRFAEVLAR